MMYKGEIEIILIVLIFIICVLIGVAYLTVGERKTMGYMQRRVGPNAVGYYGILMAIADALKLLSKEILLLHNGEIVYVISGPLITLFSALLTWGIIPLNRGITILDNEYSLLYLLGMGSIGVFGTVLVGWMSNSKYTILATVRTTAQLISYELILTTVIFLIVLLINSLNINIVVESQIYINYIIPLLVLGIIFFITALAETARPPFDNVEAESELVSGHMTELSGSPFVIFFLSEYCSMFLMSTLVVILFFGGYNIYFIDIFNNYIYEYINIVLNNNLQYGLLTSLFLIMKTNMFLFLYIWVRASFPRLRFDLLIYFCWYVLLPILFSLCYFLPGLLYSFNSFTFIMS